MPLPPNPNEEAPLINPHPTTQSERDLAHLHSRFNGRIAPKDLLPLLQIDTFGLPSDFDEPKWSEYDRVHGWRNYISDDLQRLWPTFSLLQKAAIACSAYASALKEEWE